MLTKEHIEKVLKDAYKIVYNEDTGEFDIPTDLDVSEDDHEGIEYLISEFKKLL